MAILIKPKELRQKLGIKNTYVSRLFDKPSLSTKNKLKETPI